MLALRNPREAYRRVDLDARIEGASPSQLVRLCFDQAEMSLAGALFAHRCGDNQGKSQAITKALAALTALQMGVNGEAGVAGALRQFYGATRRTLLDCAVDCDEGTVAAIRQDLTEIASALASTN